MLWILVVLLGILSLTFFSGHGSSLLPFYHVFSKEEQKTFYTKKQYRIFGMAMGFVTILVAIYAFYGDKAPDWFLVVMPILIVADLISISCFNDTEQQKKLHPEEFVKREVPPEIEEKYRVLKKRLSRVVLIFGLVLFIMLLSFLTSGSIRVSIRDDMLSVDCSYWPDYQIPVSEIQYLSYRRNFDRGKSSGALETFKLLEGYYECPDYGAYQMYAYLNCDHFIVLKTYRGILVVNGETEEETEKLFHQLYHKLQK